MKLVDDASDQRACWILSQFACYGCLELKRIVTQNLRLIGSSLLNEAEERHRAFADEMVSCCKWMDKQWVDMLRRILNPQLLFVAVQEILDQVHDLCASCSNPELDYPIIMVVMQWYLRNAKFSRRSRVTPRARAICELFQLDRGEAGKRGKEEKGKMAWAMAKPGKI